MQFNSVFQLLAMKLSGSPLLDIAESLLMMPDLFHWLLTGVKSNEMTNASTTPILRPGQRRLGDGTAGEIFAAVADSRPDHAAGHDAGAAAGERGGRVRLAVGQGGVAGHARYGQRGDGGSGEEPARRKIRVMVLGNNQEATIVSNQVKTIILNPIAPTDPLIAHRTFPRGSGKAD